MKKYFPLLLLAVSFASAQIQKAKQPANIKNGIKLTATGGVVIEKAYLQYKDGSSVPETNTTDVGQEIFLILVIKSDWVPVEDNIQVGAKEKITTSLGAVILASDDLFKDLTTISMEDSKYITLKAIITSQNRYIPYFKVAFDVWDKQGPGKIRGYYTFKTNWKKPS
jgi:hypothetical protein